jgi:MoxR-like ATPase
MAYTRLFNPDALAPSDLSEGGQRLGDQVEQVPYVYEEPITLAINVALATGRPLLISGEPGAGKSSLARDVARKLGWRYYSKTVSSRTQARDLLWSFDTIRRLSDAQVRKGVKHPAAYVEPGVLWWAFDPESAGRRGLSPGRFAELQENNVQRLVPATYETVNPAARRAVVLIDEIDKADPDVPNDLLEPLGSFRFRVIEGELDTPVKASQAPLVFITTNRERDLPKAFLRRCLALELQAPDPARLLSIARAHFSADLPNAANVVPLHEVVRDEYLSVRTETIGRKALPPSTAEYLDAISACREMQLTPDAPEWSVEWPKIKAATLSKRRES